MSTTNSISLTEDVEKKSKKVPVKKEKVKKEEEKKVVTKKIPVKKKKVELRPMYIIIF